jgi:hypothetical protein
MAISKKELKKKQGAALDKVRGQNLVTMNRQKQYLFVCQNQELNTLKVYSKRC